MVKAGENSSTTSNLASYQEGLGSEFGARIRGKQREQTRDKARDTQQHPIVRPIARTPQPGAGKDRDRPATRRKEGLTGLKSDSGWGARGQRALMGSKS